MKAFIFALAATASFSLFAQPEYQYLTCTLNGNPFVVDTTAKPVVDYVLTRDIVHHNFHANRSEYRVEISMLRTEFGYAVHGTVTNMDLLDGRNQTPSLGIEHEIRNEISYDYFKGLVFRITTQANDEAICFVK